MRSAAMNGLMVQWGQRLETLSADEVAARLAAWTPPAPNYPGGVLAKYAALVGSASQGAVTTGPRMTANLGAGR